MNLTSNFLNVYFNIGKLRILMDSGIQDDLIFQLTGYQQINNLKILNKRGFLLVNSA